MSNSSQKGCESHESAKRKHAEIEGTNNDITAEGVERKSYVERRENILRKGRRACNECRQQKLRCNVKQNPFILCSRCRRQKLECKIDLEFKRVGKRGRVLEIEQRLERLEQENKDLKNIIGLDGAQINGILAESSCKTDTSPNSSRFPQSDRKEIDTEGSDKASASVSRLKYNQSGNSEEKDPQYDIAMRCLEEVCLTPDRIRGLFEEYFAHYHHHLPLLQPGFSPDYYFNLSLLLYWTIILVSSRRIEDDGQLFQSLCKPVSRLVWSTISAVPQNYHVVKALCLLCTWPLPTSRTSTDPTFVFAGLASQIAMQVGLHRPSHAQDFSRYRLQLRQEDIEDRARTWAICVIVTQCVSIGYGQPCSAPSVLQDVAKSYDTDNVLALNKELDQRQKVAEFCAKVTSLLYINMTNGKDLQPSPPSIIVRSLALELQALESNLDIDTQALNGLHTAAATLHLRLFVLFEPSWSTNYLIDLTELYLAAVSFLDRVFILAENGYSIRYATNYIMQMLLAAGYTLHRLLNSFFKSLVSEEDGKRYFRRAICKIREMSVIHNDLPMRLAEVLAQLWRAQVNANATQTDRTVLDNTSNIDTSLQLKVRCRMSMSLVYDSVWRWREIFKTGDLDSAIEHPTDLDDPSTNAARPQGREDDNDLSLAPNVISLPASSEMDHMLSDMTMLETEGYNVFDSLGWVLDNYVDFPFQDVVGSEETSLL